METVILRLLEVTVLVTGFMDVGSGDSMDISNDYNWYRFLRSVSDVMTRVGRGLGCVGGLTVGSWVEVHFEMYLIFKPYSLTRWSTSL